MLDGRVVSRSLKKLWCGGGEDASPEYENRV